jgi:hypothetical protein
MPLAIASFELAAVIRRFEVLAASIFVEPEGIAESCGSPYQ